MKDVIKKLSLILITLSVILINPIKVSAQDSYTPSKLEKYSSYEYVIDSYDIDIVVYENNTYDITEYITAYFNVPKHGIYRTIPLKNKITRLDGTTSNNRVKLTNVLANKNSTSTIENGKYKLRLGSENETLTGEQKYLIKYNYNIGKDPMKDYDEFYYNIIGNEWDTVIGNITFKITMPKDFDKSKIGFSSGIKGSIDNSKITYATNENAIIGRYNGILIKNEALTIRIELEEGYYVGAGQASSTDYLMFIIPGAFLLISFLLWHKYGRDDQAIETVEFYPPNGFNSLETGFLYKGNATHEDVTSLLIYLANQGYIKITETEEESMFTKKHDFKITKLKEYDGNDINERLFLKGLFKCNESIDSELEENKRPNEVTSIDLENSFYKTMNEILSNINDSENKNKIIEKKSKRKSNLIILMIILSVLAMVTIPTLEYFGLEGVIQVIPLVIIYIPFFYVPFIKGVPLFFGLFWGGFTLLHSILMLSASPLKEALFSNELYLFGFLIGIICIIGMFFCFREMPKRTKYGNEIFGKIKGFKNFLETAEKEKLETMVMHDPNYFYNILPYTYVLGVSDKWISKFESIFLEAPSWYEGTSDFNVASFRTFMNDTFVSASSLMSSSPSSSSSGGSSGGGSSGGGSGGGGGGSW